MRLIVFVIASGHVKVTMKYQFHRQADKNRDLNGLYPSPQINLHILCK